jgi:diacylglycerol O-acyltransferase
VGVAIFSYDGGITFGVTGDLDTAPDIGVLCRAIERSVAELLRAPSPVPAPDKRPAPREHDPRDAASPSS